MEIGKRKQFKKPKTNSKAGAQKHTDVDAFNKANKEVKKNARRDKRNFVSKLATKAEGAVRHNNIKALYDSIWLLTIKL